MKRVYFVLDEAASLKQMDAISNALDVGRAYGICLVLIYQAVGQLKKCFPQGQEETVLASVSKVFFSVNDLATATYVSDSLGEETITVESGGTSSGNSYQLSKGMHSQMSKGDSYNTSRNWQQQARKLLKPDEIMQLPPRTAITFTPGVRPVLTTLLRYYEEKHLGGGAGWLRRFGGACAALFVSVIFFGAAALVAASLTEQADTTSHSSYSVPIQQQQQHQYGRIPYGRRMNDRGNY
jgi:type IV secretion system protein VirD4